MNAGPSVGGRRAPLRLDGRRLHVGVARGGHVAQAAWEERVEVDVAPDLLRDVGQVLEGQADRLGGVDDPLGVQGAVLRVVLYAVGRRVQFAGVGLGNDDDVLVRAHARGDGPHDLGLVVGIDVVVDNDRQLDERVSAERRQRRVAALAVVLLGDGDVGGEAAAGRKRHAHGLDRRHDSSDLGQHVGFAADHADEVVLGVGIKDVLVDGVRPARDRGDLDHVRGMPRADVPAELAERPLILADVREHLTLDHDLGVGRDHDAQRLRRAHAHRLSGQAAGDLDLVVLQRATVLRGHVDGRVVADDDRDLQRLVAELLLVVHVPDVRVRPRI